MTTLLIGTLFLAPLVVIAANNILSNTRWWLCPFCFRWHNNIGETHHNPPMTGALENSPKPCPGCARQYNDSLT